MSGTLTPMGGWQAEDGHHVALDLPGVDPGSVEITTGWNMLPIGTERRAQYGQGSNVLLAERPPGRFTRQLQVGDALDAGKVQATYDDGVLHLTILPSDQAQPRRIEVQHGSRQQLPVSGAEQGQSDQSAGAAARRATSRAPRRRPGWFAPAGSAAPRCPGGVRVRVAARRTGDARTRETGRHDRGRPRHTTSGTGETP
jgi:HSP20 family protein